MLTDFVQDQSIMNIFIIAATYAIGYASKHYADLYIAGKKELHNVRSEFDNHKDYVKNLVDDFQKVIDKLDDAVQNPAVNEAQFQQVYGASKVAWQDLKTSMYKR